MPKKIQVKSTVGGERSSRLVEPRTRCLEKTTENVTEVHRERAVSLFSSVFLKSVSELSADAEVPHGKLFPFINNKCVAGPMKQSHFNKPRGALSRWNVLNAFLPALQPDWRSNVILSKARRNKSMPRCLLLYASCFSLSGCARQVAYTSYRFLSVNTFQGEHRWATMQREERRCARGAHSQLINAAARRHAFTKACPGGLVSGMQTKESRIKEGKRLSDATEIHLAYVTSADHHSQSKHWKSRLPAPRSICLIPRARRGWKRLNGLGVSKCENPRDLHSPPNRVRM